MFLNVLYGSKISDAEQLLFLWKSKKRIDMTNKNLEIDKLDLQILAILMEDAKVPYTKIGEALFVSPGTVHVRMKKMEQNKDNTYSNLITSLKLFLKETFDISKDTDRKATIEDIKSGINMKGQNAWILIFSILIASTGLNTSSTAVVIGAMLISPLMGPINGIGYSIATYDVYLLKKSLKYYFFSMATGLVASYFYFLLLQLAVMLKN